MQILSVHAQLSDAEETKLAEKVKTNYEEFGIEGSKVYQTSKHWVLVTVVTVTSDMKISQQNRQAQMKASRAAVEYLKGAKNNSISVYDAYSEDKTSLTERNNSDVKQKDMTINSTTSTGANESSVKSEQETMSDKIVQSSIAKIDGLQTLLKMKGEEGETAYAYYMILSKHTAKKKK